MSMTKESPITLPADCSQEKFERAYEFVTKIKEIDEGVFHQYITAIKLYQSGSLNSVDLKNIIMTLFKNCDVLLDGFDRILKDLDKDSRQDDVVFVEPLNLQRINEFLKVLRRNCEELRVGFIEAFVRYKEHEDVKILKEEVDLMFRDYPCLKDEFRMILLDHGLLQDHEITREKEDELFRDDMYFHAIESAIKFAEAEDNEKPPVGVYGAIRWFYLQRRRRLPRGSMKDPKLAVRRVLEPLKRKYNELLKKRRKSLQKVQKV